MDRITLTPLAQRLLAGTLTPTEQRQLARAIAAEQAAEERRQSLAALPARA